MPMDSALKRSYSKKFDAIRQLAPETLIPEEDRWKVSIKDLSVGGFLRYKQKTWIVERAGRYHEFSENFKNKKKYYWTEFRLFCIETGETINIEWEMHDDIEISVTLKEIKFHDLRLEKGAYINENDLDKICKKGWEIFYHGKRFKYYDDYASKYYKDFSEDSDERLYVYKFKAHDNEMISIEKWHSGSGDESYEIFISRLASEDEFEMIAKGKYKQER